MKLRVPLKNWIQAIAVYSWMWVKGIPIMVLPAWALYLLGTDDDKECAELDRDVASIKRLLNHQE